MKFGWIECGSAAAVVAFVLLAGSPSNAADQSGVRTVAEELGSRTVEAPPKDKLSDSAVRVMSTFALSILPDEVPDKTGGMVKLDKSNPSVYLIPIDDARQVIRVATRSAYAEVCNLHDLEAANYETLMRTEQLRNQWSEQQMMFIRALHTFATSYFAGNVKITEQADDAAAAGAKSKDTAPAAAAANGDSKIITSKKLECSDEQRAKVAQAIKAYTAAGPKRAPATAGAPVGAPPMAPAEAAAPQAPMVGGAN